jgi:adenosylcobinamide-GDP ribazoletransferase
MTALGGALVAFRYLTVLPLPQSRAAGDVGRAAGWFPVVGLALGVCLALASLAVDRVMPPGVGAMLLVALWAGLTGGLHLDGLADSCDGLGGGWSRERTLSIMRDARSGPYGVTAIVLVLGLKAAVLASLPEGLAWRALVLAPGGLVATLVSIATLGVWGALALAVAGGMAWAWAAYLRRRLGGFTGDTLGALVEGTEAVVLTLAVSLDFLELA